MSNPIQRREFLKGAAGVVGATMLTVGPGSAVVALAAGGPAVVPVLHYWDGTRFLPAQRLASGDSNLGTVQVTIHSFGNTGRLIGIDQIVPVPQGSQTLRLPFFAWTAPPTGTSQTRFTSQTESGMVLRIRLIDGTVDFPLVTGTGTARKLKEGAYMLTFGAVSGYQYDEAHAEAPVFNGLGPRSEGYVIITIDRV